MVNHVGYQGKPRLSRVREPALEHLGAARRACARPCPGPPSPSPRPNPEALFRQVLQVLVVAEK